MSPSSDLLTIQFTSQLDLSLLFTMSTVTLMRMRSARPTGPRLRPVPAGLSIQARSKTTMPFRLPDARNEPNVSVTLMEIGTAKLTYYSLYTKKDPRSAPSSKRP
jgi:hypothetical protein